jgi:hypothetical protein
LIDLKSRRKIPVVHGKSEVLIAISVKAVVFWAVTPCRLKMATKEFSKT